MMKIWSISACVMGGSEISPRLRTRTRLRGFCEVNNPAPSLPQRGYTTSAAPGFLPDAAFRFDVLSDGIVDSYLQDLVVHPEYQRKGIGSELMRRAITFLQNKNIKCIQVTFNPEFEPFYRKFGFYIYRAGIIDRDTMPLNKIKF